MADHMKHDGVIHDIEDYQQVAGDSGAVGVDTVHNEPVLIVVSVVERHD